MDQHADVDKRPRARRLRAQATMTLTAWLFAFLVVLAISTVFDDELASLPRPLRALLLSGVLVALMVNVVMPGISAALSRRLPSPSDTDLDRAHVNPRGDRHDRSRPPNTPPR